MYDMYLSMTQSLVMEQLYILPHPFFPSHSVSLNLSFQSIVAKLVALHLPWISIQDQGSVEYPQA